MGAQDLPRRDREAERLKRLGQKQNGASYEAKTGTGKNAQGKGNEK